MTTLWHFWITFTCNTYFQSLITDGDSKHLKFDKQYTLFLNINYRNFFFFSYLLLFYYKWWNILVFIRQMKKMGTNWTKFNQEMKRYIIMILYLYILLIYFDILNCTKLYIKHLSNLNTLQLQRLKSSLRGLTRNWRRWMIFTQEWKKGFAREVKKCWSNFK